ncbi:MAG: HNH endonuclease [Candidatus Krumholzibacteriia bacterium]
MDDVTLDTDVRREAFAFLTNAAQWHGDVFPWDVLANGFVYRGRRICLIGQKGIWKPKLLPRMPISISTAPPHTGRPAPYDDGLDESGRLSYRYRGTDPAHPDNAGLREAMRTGTPLIYFFGVAKGQYLATWPVYIVDDAPRALTFKVSVDDRVIGIGPEATAGADFSRDIRREYVTVVAVRRLHQQAFRARVIRAYREQCAVCRLKHAELLDAAHILPDGDPRGEPVLSNGLALCKIHHAAFDRHILGVRPDLVVEVRRDILEEVDGLMLRYGLQEMTGRVLSVPARRPDRLDPSFLEERYAAFRRAG